MRQRSGWAVLAAGAMVASLLAVGAGPAAALDEDSEPNAEADTSACVGDATKDHMFDDVSEGHYFRGAINCLAYYGVTVGYGDGTFRPNADVSNEEMVLFMQRAAGVAGADAEEVVGDFAETGSDPVNRGDMALLIARLLASATDTVTTKDDDGTFMVKDANGDDVTGGDWDYFADSRRLLSRVKDSATSALYELGVAKGTGMGYFSPSRTVSRGAMAAFITRALAHTSARPEGVTAQQMGDKVLVSVRDENYAPEANVWVEVFWVAAADEDAALTDDSECGPLVERSGGTGDPPVYDGGFVCEIDGADLLTSGDGDATTQGITVPEGGAVAWAWSGDVGDVVDADTKLHRLELTAVPAAARTSTKAVISTDHKSKLAKIGSVVTYNLQLQDTVGDVTGGGRDAGDPAKWLVTISTAVNVKTEANPTGSLDDNNDGTIDATEAAAVATNAILRSTVPVTSDADGKASFTVASPPDPSDESGNEFVVLFSVGVDARNCDPGATWTVCDAPADSGSGNPTANPPIPPDAAVENADGSEGRIGFVRFSDEAAAPATISIDTSSYVVVAGRTGRTALNRATVTLSDQYGDPVRSRKVTLTSDLGDNPGATPAVDGASSLILTTAPASEATPTGFTTDRDGSYTFGYTYSSTIGDVETIQARYFDDKGDDDAANDLTITKLATVRWAQDAGATGTGEAIDDGDVEANQIVAEVDVSGEARPMVLTYDEDDRFNINEDGNADGASPVSMAAFEKLLAKWLETEGSANELLTWENYSSRPRNTSVFTLHTS